jgi:hypothetical protein
MSITEQTWSSEFGIIDRAMLSIIGFLVVFSAAILLYRARGLPMLTRPTWAE